MESSMLDNKWVSTVASIWIQSTSGTPSTFGIYSPALKSSQGYSQTTLDTVALFKDLGANVGILAGVLYAATAYRPSFFGGPKVAILAGIIQRFSGYFLIWLTVVGIIHQPPIPLVCLFLFMAGHAMPFFNTANVVTAVHNFRDYSGTAVGIMKGCLGLSAAMLIQLYQTIFKGNPASFLLMVSLLSTINPLLLMWFVKIYDTNSGDERRHLNNFSLVVLVVSAYLVVVIILENVITVQLIAHILILVILLLLLASPLWIALRAQHSKASERISNQMDPEILHGRADNLDYQRLSDASEETDCINGVPELEGHFNLFQAMRTMNFWLLFLATACALGSGLATLNNITQIGEALGYTPLETTTLVSLWSIWNSLGRFGGGYVSDYILHMKGWARPLFMAISLAIMSIGHLIIASGMPGCLYAGSILVGICYGSQLSLMPTIASEIFGVVNMGTIFNTITIAGPLGSYILSVRVVGYIYDKETSVESNICVGVHCFMVSFFIMAAVTFLGSLFAVGLSLRTRSYYDRVICRRFFNSKASS